MADALYLLAFVVAVIAFVGLIRLCERIVGEAATPAPQPVATVPPGSSTP